MFGGGPRTGGGFNVLSPNFDTLGSDICSGSEVNQVRAIAAGGPTDVYGSKVVYATTSGLGPLNGPLSTPPGGHVWVTTNATAGATSFADVTSNGPQGSINANQFPISGVAIDSYDATGDTAYVTVMGFTGGPGHVWKTANAGAAWIDFTANLPDSPVNAVVVDPVGGQIYVGTDVGVFATSTLSANWTELGPNPSTSQSGFLPNVAVTALGLFNSAAEKLLRASTYGRGIWQYTLFATPNYELSISNSPQTLFAGQNATFNGTATALNGYTSSVTLSCVSGSTAPPSTCAPSPSTLTPGTNTPFTVTAGGANGDYSFNVQGVGSDTKHITNIVPVVLHVISFGLTAPVPSSETVPRGTTSTPVSFQVTAAGSFNQSVTVSCSDSIANATCALTPGTSVNPTSTTPVNMTSVTVPAGTATGSYPVTIQATTAGTSATLTTSFTLTVTSNPDFILGEPSAFPEVNAGSTGVSGPISITSQDGFSGTVSLSCPTTYGAGSCSITPTSVNSYPATATLIIYGTSFTAGSYSLAITGTSGTDTHSISVPFNVGDDVISGTQSLSLAPGSLGTANLTLTSSTYYSGAINATCDASALAGAMCTLSPVNPIVVSNGSTANLIATINVPNDAAIGTYNIKINTEDTTGKPAHNFGVALTVVQDFVVISTTLSQTVNAGQTTGPYNLTVQPVGASFNGAVTLSCSSLPALAQCSFDPAAPVTPGNSAVNVVMTITTTAATSSARMSARSGWKFYAVWLLLPGFVVGLISVGSGKRKRAPLVLITLFLLLVLPSCSGVSSGGGGGGGARGQGTPPGTYQVKVTGTSSGVSADAGQTTRVTLVVN